MKTRYNSLLSVGVDPLLILWEQCAKGCFWSLSNLRVISVMVLLFTVVPTVSQQNTCSCAPLEYEWILNLTNPCSPIDVDVGPITGIKEIFCNIDVDQFNTSDTSVDSVPVFITSYLIVELVGGNILQNNDVALTDGNIIDFVSETTAKPEFIAKGFLGEIVGRNAAGEKVELNLLIEFTNRCETPPLKLGDSIGWLTYVSY